ncbi:hypothetical protein [Rhodohalobacter sp. 614A]|uniref:hypothetical protein n=1 Tax=Rhodohalobacter sp. 614A TaxID=2908649 RepID=UPI001F3BAFA8|nr:hypothetical protein [Rhodohalobacter sp. 614A]
MTAIKRIILPSVPGTLAEGTEVFVEDGSGGLDLYIGNSSNNPVLVSANQFAQSGDVIEVSDIVDNLTSNDTDKPLSANQGKVLNNNKANLSSTNTFSDLQTFNNGISFGADTLNEYNDTITWTPTYNPTSGSFSSITYGNQIGHAIKIGKLVICTVDLSTNDIDFGTASGSLSIGGLPFSVLNQVNMYVSLVQGWEGNLPSSGQGSQTGTNIPLHYRNPSTGAIGFTNLIQVSDLNDGSSKNWLKGHVFYFAS